MVLDSLFGRWPEIHHLDGRPVLLHDRFWAVLRCQRAVAPLSELIARLGFVCAIRLTRHPRNRKAGLPFESWLEVPVYATFVNEWILLKGILIDLQFQALSVLFL